MGIETKIDKLRLSKAVGTESSVESDVLAAIAAGTFYRQLD